MPRPKRPSWLTFVAPEDVPARVRKSVVGSLPMWEFFERVAVQVKKHNAVPFKNVAVIDLGLMPEIKKLKQPRQTVMTKVREFVKTRKLNAKIIVYARGNKIFVEKRT